MGGEGRTQNARRSKSRDVKRERGREGERERETAAVAAAVVTAAAAAQESRANACFLLRGMMMTMDADAWGKKERRRRKQERLFSHSLALACVRACVPFSFPSLILSSLSRSRCAILPPPLLSLRISLALLSLSLSQSHSQLSPCGGSACDPGPRGPCLARDLALDPGIGTWSAVSCRDSALGPGCWSARSRVGGGVGERRMRRRSSCDRTTRVSALARSA